MRHYSKEGICLLIVAQARQEAWKGIQEKIKVSTHKILHSFPRVSDKETLKITSFERWNVQGTQLLQQFKELNSAGSTQKGQECREACIRLISQFFDAVKESKLAPMKEIFRSCTFKDLRKYMQPIIQALRKAYSLILILQLGNCQHDDPNRKQQEHDFKLLLKLMLIPKELALFALYTQLSPDLFRLLCQWFSDQDRLSLMDQACQSPCSLEQMIILFWKGDPEKIVYSISHLTSDSPFIEDPLIVTHFKKSIQSHAQVGILEFLFQRMNHQHEKAFPSQVLDPIIPYLNQLKEIFELGLQHALSIQILQGIQKKIVQIHVQLHSEQKKAQDYFSQLFSNTLTQQGPMKVILTLLEILPGSPDLSKGLMIVLKSQELENSSWN